MAGVKFGEGYVQLKVDTAEFLRALRDAEKQSRVTTTDIGQNLGRLVKGFIAFKGVQFLGGLVKEGIEFNAMLETTRLAMGALVNQFGIVKRNGKEITDPQDKWNASMEVSLNLQKQIRVAALQTTAEYSELVTSLQFSLGPALRAGFDTDQIVKFNTVVAQTAGAIGLPMHQLGQEIRAIFEGDVSKNSRIAQLIFSDIPTKNVKAQIKEWVAAGTFYDELMKRMASFAKAGEQAANTYAGALSNLKDAFHQALGEATQSNFSNVTQMIKELTAEIVTFDAEGNAVFNQDFVDSIQSVATALVDVAKAMVLVAKYTGPAIQLVRDFGTWMGEQLDRMDQWLEKQQDVLKQQRKNNRIPGVSNPIEDFGAMVGVESAESLRARTQPQPARPRRAGSKAEQDEWDKNQRLIKEENILRQKQLEFMRSGAAGGWQALKKEGVTISQPMTHEQRMEIGKAAAEFATSPARMAVFAKELMRLVKPGELPKLGDVTRATVLAQRTKPGMGGITVTGKGTEEEVITQSARKRAEYENFIRNQQEALELAKSQFSVEVQLTEEAKVRAEVQKELTKAKYDEADAIADVEAKLTSGSEKERWTVEQVEAAKAVIRERYAAERVQIETEGARKIREIEGDRVREMNAAMEEVAAAAREAYADWLEAYNEMYPHWSEGISQMIESWGTFEQRVSDGARSLAETTAGFFSDYIFDALTGNLESAEDAFKGFFKSLLRQIIDFMTQQAVLTLIGKFFGVQSIPISGSITQFSGPGVANAYGNVLRGGWTPVKAFASGGIVKTPTLGLVGEAGQNEAVVPLPDGRSIPVAMANGGAQAPIDLNMRVVLSPEMFQAMKTSPEEIEMHVNSSILRNGEIRKTIRARG